MKKTEQTFEQSLTELEKIVRDMETGEMPLDKMLVSYRRGVELAEGCREKLNAVEVEVKKLEKGRLLPLDDEH